MRQVEGLRQILVEMVERQVGIVEVAVVILFTIVQDLYCSVPVIVLFESHCFHSVSHLLMIQIGLSFQIEHRIVIV